MPLNRQLANPLAHFPAPWNQGYSLSFPLVDPQSGDDAVSGVLRFGLGREADNEIPRGVVRLALDVWGGLPGRVGVAPGSMPLRLESGLPVNYLPLQGLPVCADLDGSRFTPYCCPAQPTAVAIGLRSDQSQCEVDVLVAGDSGLITSRGAQPGATVVSYGASVAVLGMPFFYGRTVFYGWPAGERLPHGWVGV